jgi:hypothetical protein
VCCTQIHTRKTKGWSLNRRSLTVGLYHAVTRILPLCVFAQLASFHQAFHPTSIQFLRCLILSTATSTFNTLAGSVQRWLRTDHLLSHCARPSKGMARRQSVQLKVNPPPRSPTSLSGLSATPSKGARPRHRLFPRKAPFITSRAPFVPHPQSKP